MKGLPLLWGWAVLVRADADVAAVPGQRTTGGRAGWEGAGQLVLEAVTFERASPRRIPAQAPSFLGFAPDLGRGLFFKFSVVLWCLILALLNIPSKASFIRRLNDEVTQDLDWFNRHIRERAEEGIGKDRSDGGCAVYPALEVQTAL